MLEFGRAELQRTHRRSFGDRLMRTMIAKVLGNARIFDWLLRIGRAVRPILPSPFKDSIPLVAFDASDLPAWPKTLHKRRFVALAGWVQGALSPITNLAAAVVLDRLGITLIEVPGSGCCGAMDLHTTDELRAKTLARALIDKWYPYLEQGIEGFVMTASGCGVTILAYPQLFRDDPDYLQKAQAISAKTVDLCEVLDKEIGATFRVQNSSQKVAFHAPCTLQHGQKITHTVEKVLQRVGYQLCQVKDAHLCCGSAGTYSMFHPHIAEQLVEAKLRFKLRLLYNDNPDIVCTANVGCQTHLNLHVKGYAPGRTSIRHWIELLL